MNLWNKLRWESDNSERKETLNISITMYDNWDIWCVVKWPEEATKEEATDWFYQFLSKYFIPFWWKLLLDTKVQSEQFKMFLDMREKDIKELKELIDSWELW